MNTLRIVNTAQKWQLIAQSVAQHLGIQLNSPLNDQQYTLEFSDLSVALHSHTGGKTKPISVCFHEGASNHRRKFGGGKGQMIAKAVGISANFKPKVLDATAGLGGDAFVLASLGCEVTLQERSPIARALLAGGLNNSIEYAREQDLELAAVLERMQLKFEDSTQHMPKGFDVIYLDPMFPERKKSAAVGKEMRVFHDLIGTDSDAGELLPKALESVKYRVVVKRPRIAPCLNDQKPMYSLEGKSSRFDIYSLNKMPS